MIIKIYNLLLSGVIYDETVTEQTVNLVNIAIESINDKFSYGRNIWSVKISIINVRIKIKF